MAPLPSPFLFLPGRSEEREFIMQKPISLAPAQTDLVSLAVTRARYLNRPSSK